MGKKLGLDKQYSSLLTSVNKNSPSGVLGKAYKSIGTFPKVSGVSSSKLLNVGKKVFSKTPIGKAVNLAINVGSGIGIGYSYAKNKFNKKKADFQKGDYSDIKTDKKMGGGMMQGYGAARTSGMGLEDQSLMPGKMVRASKGKMTKLKKAALTTTALLGANYLGKRSGEKAIIDSINSGQAFKPEGAKMSLFGVSLKRSKGGGMDMGSKKSKMLNFKSDKERKDYTKQAIASLEGITESFKDKLNPMKAQRLLDRLPKKKIKKVKMNKARFGDFMNTFIADDTRSVAGKSGGADSGTAGEMRSKLGKSDVVEKKKIKNYIKKKVEQSKTVIKKTKEAAKKTGTILATPIKKFHEFAEENVRKNGPVRIYKPRTMNKGGGMDMGKKEEPTQWITKKEKPTQWITKKEKKQNWITKKEKKQNWITKKEK